MPDASKEFTALGLQLGKTSPFITYLLLKKNISQQTDCALYVAGLPYGINDDVLKTVFSSFGAVSGVGIQPSKTSAVLLFQDASSVTAALKAAASGAVIECEHEVSGQPRGLKAWVQQHKAKRPGNAALSEQLDKWMEQYDVEEERQRKAREEAMAEDGWTVVVRSKGHKRVREDEGVTYVTGGVASAAAQAAAAAKKPKVHETFYRFQQREQRRNELMQLREKFEADKKRIQALRSARNFRPS